VHAVGGTLGAFITGIFASSDVNPNLDTNLKDVVGHSLWLEQLKAMGLTLVLSIVGTLVLANIVKAVVGLRPTQEDEETGLDLTDHGERGYHT
jgi:Amt family ammonium transporter